MEDVGSSSLSLHGLHCKRSSISKSHSSSVLCLLLDLVALEGDVLAPASFCLADTAILIIHTILGKNQVIRVKSLLDLAVFRICLFSHFDSYYHSAVSSLGSPNGFVPTTTTPAMNFHAQQRFNCSFGPNYGESQTQTNNPLLCLSLYLQSLFILKFSD